MIPGIVAGSGYAAAAPSAAIGLLISSIDELDPPESLLLSGDEQDDGDSLLLSGDEN